MPRLDSRVVLIERSLVLRQPRIPALACLSGRFQTTDCGLDVMLALQDLQR